MSAQAPQAKKQKGKKPDYSKMIALIFFLLAGVLLYFAFDETEVVSLHRREISSQPTAKGKANRHEKLVNMYLQELNRKAKMDQQKIINDNYFQAPQIGQTLPTQEIQQSFAGIDMNQEDANQKVADDLDPLAKERRLRQTPDNQIQSQLADKQNDDEYYQAYREAYVQAFVENAKRNGYNVKVNKDLIVISVTPISNFQRIPSSSNGDYESGSSY